MKIHTVEGKKLEFNDENLVAVYQEKYRLYDRFLPHLASYLKGTVVDVGANCGALAVAMGVKNPSLEFVCIEPEDKHLQHLHKNVLQISNRVQVDRAKIGTQYKLLDKVIEQFEVKDIGLLKIDVDGFEPKVVAGARRTLARPEMRSLLIETNQNLRDHMDMVLELNALGFKHDPAQVQRAERKEGTFKGVAEYVFRR